MDGKRVGAPCSLRRAVLVERDGELEVLRLHERPDRLGVLTHVDHDLVHLGPEHLGVVGLHRQLGRRLWRPCGHERHPHRRALEVSGVHDTAVEQRQLKSRSG